MAEDMDAEERLLKRRLYKLAIISLKVIPIILSLCAIINTFFSYFCIPTDIFSIVGGISILPLLFLYLVSYVFEFCVYHRMFLHYLLAVNVLNLYDYYIGIPVSDRNLFAFYNILTGVFLFLVLYYYRKEKCCK